MRSKSLVGKDLIGISLALRRSIERRSRPSPRLTVQRWAAHTRGLPGGDGASGDQAPTGTGPGPRESSEPGGLGSAMDTLAITLTVFVLAFVGFAAWRWLSALGEVTRGLERLGVGQKARLVLSAPAGPIGNLSRAFNTAAAEVQIRHERLDQDRQQLRVVLEAMDEAVIAVDTRHRLLFANASASDYSGLKRRRPAGLSRSSFAVRRYKKRSKRPCGWPARTRIKASLACPAGRSDRAAGRVLSARGTPLPGRPAPGVVLVFHDVTELRRLERMRQDFVANASHELKTPLASIKAYTETLLDWALHDETVNIGSWSESTSRSNDSIS